MSYPEEIISFGNGGCAVSLGWYANRGVIPALPTKQEWQTWDTDAKRLYVVETNHLIEPSQEADQ